VNVLIIHQHFKFPEDGGAIRSYYLAKALADRGIRVDVVTATNTKKYMLRVVDGFNVHCLPIPYENKFGFWRRGRAFIKFVWAATSLSAKLPALDICYAISVPLTTGLTAMWLKRFHGLRYIFEVGDLWPDAPIALGFVKDRTLQATLKWLERTIYRHSTAIVALSVPIKEAIQRKVAGKDVCVIPNMADIEFYGPAKAHSEFRHQHALEKQLVVSYIGAVGFANGLDHLIECARSAQQTNLSVYFFICGEGAMLEQHKLAVNRLSLKNVTFLQFRNREGVKQLMDASDAIFVSYRPFRILETGSPNKYFDGLAAGKLIVVNFEGWIKDEIEHERCGVYVDRQRPDKFAEIIQPFILDASLLKRNQQAARNLAERKYSRALLSERVASLVETVVKGGPASDS